MLPFNLPDKTFLAICVCIALLFASCDKNLVLETQQGVKSEKWDYSDVKKFTVDIKDTVQHYDIHVTLRHGFNFEWRNLWIKIETTFPGGRIFERRVNLVLSEADGEWFGDCLGDNCDIIIPIQENAYFPELGTYTFKITQDMRQTPLRYVKSVGMRIVKNKAPGK